MDLTEKNIAFSLSQDHRFGCRNNFLAVPNVSWGLFEWGECDYLLVSKNYYMSDIEIKLTLADLKIDAKKKKWKDDFKDGYYGDIRSHWYIIPKEIINDVLLFSRKESGLVSFERTEAGRIVLKTVREPIINKLAKKACKEKLLKIARLGCFRIWKNL